MSADNTGGNLGGNGTVKTVVNVVGARNTTVTSSCEHGKTVALVPASTNAAPVVPLLSGTSQNSLPM